VKPETGQFIAYARAMLERGRRMNRIARQATLEDRLEAKAARGDCRAYPGPSLDEMSRAQRRKLLYGA